MINYCMDDIDGGLICPNCSNIDELNELNELNPAHQMHDFGWFITTNHSGHYAGSFRALLCGCCGMMSLHHRAGHVELRADLCSESHLNSMLDRMVRRVGGIYRCRNFREYERAGQTLQSRRTSYEELSPPPEYAELIPLPPPVYMDRVDIGAGNGNKTPDAKPKTKTKTKTSAVSFGRISVRKFPQ